MGWVVNCKHALLAVYCYRTTLCYHGTSHHRVSVFLCLPQAGVLSKQIDALSRSVQFICCVLSGGKVGILSELLRAVLCTTDIYITVCTQT